MLKKLETIENKLSNQILEDNGIIKVRDTETFVPVEGWPNYYISNDGRLLFYRYWNNTYRIVQPSVTGNGYYTYTLSNGHTRQCVPAARLVFMAFYDIQYPRDLWPYLQGHHRNGIRTDNRAENIEPLLDQHHHFIHHFLELSIMPDLRTNFIPDYRNFKNYEDELAAEIGVTLPVLMDALVNAPIDDIAATFEDVDEFKIKCVDLNGFLIMVRMKDAAWPDAYFNCTCDDEDEDADLGLTQPDQDQRAAGGDAE